MDSIQTRNLSGFKALGCACAFSSPRVGCPNIRLIIGTLPKGTERLGVQQSLKGPTTLRHRGSNAS